MQGDFPPNSSDTFFNAAPALAAISRPTAVEPVKDTIANAGCVMRESPYERAEPEIKLKTPIGIPASSAASANTNADKGAWLLGFRTTVFPINRAGITF